jgi:hypothetical protein
MTRVALVRGDDIEALRGGERCLRWQVASVLLLSRTCKLLSRWRRP